MAAERIQAWLRRKQRRDCCLALLLSGLALLAGLGAMVLTFCLLCFLNLFLASAAMGSRPLPVGWPLGLTLLLAAALFVDSMHSRRDDLSNPALWLLRESLGLGPRLLLESCRRGRRAARLAGLNLQRCAAVLAWLAPRKGAASSAELLHAFPGLAWPGLRSQLSLIEGVWFLRTDGSRITLSPPLRLRLQQMLFRKAPAQEAPRESAREAAGAQATPVTEPEQLSPREILGVSPSASLAEIKAAYRSRIKECHPDRFAGLDPASLQLAEDWTKALNAAYAALLEQAGKKR